MRIRAAVSAAGDEIVIERFEVDAHKRKGLVLEVIETEGREHYPVRWDDDGHESIDFPGSGASLAHLKSLGTR